MKRISICKLIKCIALSAVFLTIAATSAMAAYSGPIPASVAELSSLSGGASLFYTAPLVSAIPVAKAKSITVEGYKKYEITMKQGSFKFHPSFPNATPTWGYDDGFGGYLGYLGPTIETERDAPIRVKYVNSLPSDPTGPFGWADNNLIPMELQEIGGRAVVHLHGGHVPTQFDGGPENSFPPGQTRTYEYSNAQRAKQMWYHDHAMGVTRLNAYAGLAALWFIRGPLEDYFNFPSGNYEVPLVIQDKAFYNDNGQVKLWYYKPWNPEFFGNVILVNAQPWPIFHVEPRKYRFRILNASQARFFNLRLTTSTPAQTAAWGKSSDLPFWQIGNEGGLLPSVVKVGGNGMDSTNGLMLGGAERADVIVDFSKFQGQSVYLSNDAITPEDLSGTLTANSPDAPTFTGTPGTGSFPSEPVINVMQVMKFVVDKPLSGKDNSFAPFAGRALDSGAKKLNPNGNVAQFRQITLVEQPYAPGDFNGDPANKVLVNNRAFTAAGGNITETPRLGTTEVWQFVNMTPDVHPMHMHLVNFQVIGRQQLVTSPGAPNNTPEYLNYQYGTVGNGSQISTTGDLRNSVYVTGSIVAPDANESGMKETVRCPPGWVTYVIVHFDGPYYGKFVYHCHILDHEESDMMQYMDVQPNF